MNILTTGRLGEEFSGHLKSNELGLNVRYVKNMSQKDINWADSLASFPVNEEINLSRMKWIHSFGAGVEGFIKRKDLNRNLILTRTVGSLGYKMGEYCLCHILNFAQNTFQIYNNQKSRLWQPAYPKSVKDNNVLILGTGEMAKGISNVLTKAGIHIIGVNTNGLQVPGFTKCLSFESIKTIANKVDCIISTLPLNMSTSDLLNNAFFDLFKGILFINVGRGKSVEVKDLEKAINSQNVAFAVLDVFEEEPLPKESTLWDNPNILVTPHQAAITDIQDVIKCFNFVYESIRLNERNAMFVDIEKGY